MFNEPTAADAPAMLTSTTVFLRNKAPSKALPQTAPHKWKPGPYRTGDGDTKAFQRPGSDHKHIKSFGNLT